MKGKVVFLGLLLICLATDASEARSSRRPSCPQNQEVIMCAMNYSPVCGSDGRTYPNECNLCSTIQDTGKNILITKESAC